MNNVHTETEPLKHLETVRRRAHAMLALAREGALAHFEYHDEKRLPTALFVAEVTKTRYPTLEVPPHTRWRHFEMAGIDRIAPLCAGMSARDRGRMLTEIALISVLLDAGAGKDWSFMEAESGMRYSRSEGLALAALKLFKSGHLSSEPGLVLQADAKALQALDANTLAEVFQVSDTNPLTGLEGRAALLRRLGARIEAAPEYFGSGGRAGGLFDVLSEKADTGRLSVKVLFRTLLDALAPIWPARLQYAGESLGDVWTHKALQSADPLSAFVPFHKLTQWLTGTMVEALEHAHITVLDTECLTGLAEYRNGGLFLDTGLLTLRDKAAQARVYCPEDELVVEWRALTVALLDEVAESVREVLGKTSDELPLPAVLQGGTWEAGRRIARQMRPDGTPPLQVISDGTLF
ncbi:putative biotin synthetase like protein [Legionella geestiana]|uniref:Putative biotin synthetase like protein n=1 Tax=Legionella geestiana TaxID=45065 RepID=A0A0W0U4H2_9GAMM|nr:DUF1688 family protein [Legionella geestiana]KTD02666.1 putative biotin synthetase like protein [Legionella geestiana]QBS12738.1 DUF1688 family protein [Legionella geestiana]STX54794.1 putative biotin synthetase like protein [Legionella geestiana]